ncbi:four helix bundle protein [Lentisphaera profundi]|uniref:Four helix bundle protein n=1 Tax=Lentisphaera profundi TaxID=1658616 RepID=A0ABY7VZ92_9BACT|nr:four helix bundle protein [Lentisphaera profundi]WDE98187.1 four helix bundle protein [Lentisphaera profundi]
MIHYYEKLEVWKQTVDLSLDIYKVLHNCKDYGLRDQMQRAAVSIPSNIAEGSQRNSDKEFIRFLNISKGSAAELNTQIIIAFKLNYFPEAVYNKLRSKLKDILQMTSGLIASLQK